MHRGELTTFVLIYSKPSKLYKLKYLAHFLCDKSQIYKVKSELIYQFRPSS